MPQPHEQPGAIAPTPSAWPVGMKHLAAGFYADQSNRLHIDLVQMLEAYHMPVTSANLDNLMSCFVQLAQVLGTPVRILEVSDGN